MSRRHHSDWSVPKWETSEKLAIELSNRSNIALQMANFQNIQIQVVNANSRWFSGDGTEVGARELLLGDIRKLAGLAREPGLQLQTPPEIS